MNHDKKEYCLSKMDMNSSTRLRNNAGNKKWRCIIIIRKKYLQLLKMDMNLSKKE